MLLGSIVQNSGQKRSAEYNGAFNKLCDDGKYANRQLAISLDKKGSSIAHTDKLMN